MSIKTYREDTQFSRNAECKSALNAALGLAGESGEVSELVKKELFQGRAYEPQRMLEELGDVLWYLDCMAEVHGFTLDDVAHANVNKLRARYPEGFVKGGGIREVSLCRGSTIAKCDKPGGCLGFDCPERDL